jgi:hypothetical protein
MISTIKRTIRFHIFLEVGVDGLSEFDETQDLPNDITDRAGLPVVSFGFKSEKVTPLLLFANCRGISNL